MTTVVVARGFRGSRLYLTSSKPREFTWSANRALALQVSVSVALRIMKECEAFERGTDAFAIDKDDCIIASHGTVHRAQPVPPLRCQCEHDKHFMPLPGEHPHAYHAFTPDVEPFKTPFSTLNVCADCRDTCLAIYKDAS